MSEHQYAVSVDSRSRAENEPDNRYTVNLYRTLDRIKTIQLASFQYKDCRYAFDAATLKYSEPLVIPPNTYLRFEETTTTVVKATRQTLQTQRHVSMLVPPTLNRIVAVTGDDVTTEYAPGLYFGCRYYPLIGLRLSVCGADFPADLAAFTTPSFPREAGPVLTMATVRSPYKTFTYAANYLAELSGGVGDSGLRHVGPGYHSYVHAPKPTLVELFTMLNAACNDMNQRSDVTDTVVAVSNTSPIVVTTLHSNDLVSGDEVHISGVLGTTAANGTWFIERVAANAFSLTTSVGNGVYAGGGVVQSPQRLTVPVKFGFDGNTVCAIAHSRVVDTPTTTVTSRLRLRGSLAALLGFNDVNLDGRVVASLPTSILRTIHLQSGTPTREELARVTEYRLREGTFLDADDSVRTLYFNIQLHALNSIVIPYGRFTGPQLATYLTTQLSPLPNQVRVTFDATTGTFTFTHEQGLNFTLDFISSSELISERLGFMPRIYSGRSAYTSDRSAMFGDDAPANDYRVVIDENDYVTFYVQPPIMMHTIQGTSTAGVDAVWLSVARDQQPFAQHYGAGDVLTAVRPTFSGTQDSTKPMLGASNSTPIVISINAHGLVDGDNVTIANVQGNTGANGTWTIANVTPATFELVGSHGTGSYVAGTGDWWSNVALGVASPLYTVVVQQAWDATLAPRLILQPTASIFSTEDGVGVRQTLATPADTDGRIILQSAQRNVFMLHFQPADGAAQNFGFPVVVWPPADNTQLSPLSPDLRHWPTYDTRTLRIPVASAYTSPFPCNLLPPDYIIIVLKSTNAALDIQSHSYQGTSFPIFAKLLITYPYSSVSQNMMFTTFAGHARLNNLVIEFQHPDGTLVNFNGRPHTFTLLFSIEENTAVLPCI